ncbi:TfuA-like protein [Nitratireductor sp. GCM10026969]|uniref:TfuA-like protein n=1 Tax=Nitratireductor sp. GCM10026969 TaxID=3252645 RepID=UPI003616C1DD
MSVIVFCGPTLRGEELAPYRHFEFRPPVRQGDLYAAARTKPKAIGIIDGYFDGVPAVWHKEVLWALSNGVAVFGASSMGALRAAELHSFGMYGVGRIFEDYRDGRLTDDDEVALVHGPPETCYLCLSEPMVNIRATVERALAEGILDSPSADMIVAAAKSQFYQERTWTNVLATAEEMPATVRERLLAWLPTGKVDCKRDDALELLRTIDDFMSRGEKPASPSFSFEWTEAWARVPWLAASQGKDNEGEGEAVLDELRLEGDAYARTRQAALLQVLANEATAREGLEPQRREIAEEILAFRLPLGMMRQKDVEHWAAENDIDIARFERLMADRAALEKLARQRDAELRPWMLDQLRQENAYTALRERARAKARFRESAEGDAKIPPPMLVSWYFGTRLGRDVPYDLAAYVAAIGFPDLDRFYELLAMEYALSVRGAEPERSGAQRKPRLT